MKKTMALLLLLAIPAAAFSQTNDNQTMKKTERYTRGWDKLRQIDGEAGVNVVNSFEDFSPELSRFIGKNG